ncbi:hypothetical protein CTE05_37600 [Cellulomonas terrae]|uniref:Uncharacterized protein n=1 Tax=Cellulomonas terrae TaxID=311234 RepID=A0A511JRT8_9CELL|nr:hypothetical protein CTE05_37600 [Cellulomonas terrae]
MCRGSGRVHGVVKTTGIGTGQGSGPGWCPECDGQGWIVRNDPHGLTVDDDDT